MALAHQDTLVAIINLASVLDDLGHGPEAETMYRRCLDAQLCFFFFHFGDGSIHQRDWGAYWSDFLWPLRSDSGSFGMTRCIVGLYQHRSGGQHLVHR